MGFKIIEAVFADWLKVYRFIKQNSGKLMKGQHFEEGGNGQSAGDLEMLL